MKKLIYLLLCSCIYFFANNILAQTDSEANRLINQILQVEQLQRDIVKNVTFDVTFIEGKNKHGEFVE